MTVRWWLAVAASTVVDSSCPAAVPPVSPFSLPRVPDPIAGDQNFEAIKANFDQMTLEFPRKSLSFPQVPTLKDDAGVKDQFLQAKQTFPFTADRLNLPFSDDATWAPDKIQPSFDAIVDAYNSYRSFNPFPFTAGNWEAINQNFDKLANSLADKGLTFQPTNMPGNEEAEGAGKGAGGKGKGKDAGGGKGKGKDAGGGKGKGKGGKDAGGKGADAGDAGGGAPTASSDEKRTWAQANFNTVALLFRPSLRLNSVPAPEDPNFVTLVSDNFKKIQKAYNAYCEVLAFQLLPVVAQDPLNDRKIIRDNFFRMTRIFPEKDLKFRSITPEIPLDAGEINQAFQRGAQAFSPNLVLRDISGSAADYVATRRLINENFQKLKSAWDTLGSASHYYEWTWYQDEIDSDKEHCNEED